MTSELDKIRGRFGQFLILLFWIHVPLLALVSWWVDRPALGVVLASVGLAAAYHLSWLRHGAAPATRYLSAVAVMGEPALLVYLLSGNPWQMDMHMYFFATLALTIAWCDKRAILFAAAAVAVHHLLLDFLLPYAVFPGGSDFSRVLLHAGIVAFQTAVLVWLSQLLVESFGRIGAMSTELIAKNVTLEERTRDAEAANRAKGMFLANMSHEIRTPMNAILGFCHLALRTDLSARQRDYVTKINGAGTSLLRLINDLLDFSKNEAGKLSLESRPFSLQAAVDEQLHLARMAATAKGIDVRAIIDDGVPDILIGDELRFNQVLLNLVSNAVKFTEQGKVTVSIHAADRDGDAIALNVRIEDTGIGMTQDQLASLFSSFNQADNSTTRRFGGTGLGLAISKQIVALMGGEIQAESRPGEGSTFSFTVNLKVGDSLAVPVLSVLPAELATLRVLIADDNPGSREILQGIFAAWSIRVDLVASGLEVLGAVESADMAGRPYDLLLLDWKMPGLNGIDTVKAMRASAKLTHMPSILLVTAYGHDEFRSEADAADITSFLIKPVDPQILFETITGLFATERTLNAGAESPDAVPMVAPSLRGLRVLLVEDNDINREIAVELLSDAGLTVDIAENGRIACDRVAANGATYSGVLMDVQMPEMDGIEATVQIRRKWTADHLPIIAMTAHAYEAERQRCFTAGMNDHIAKPVDPAVLVQTLNRWLRPAKELTAPAIDAPRTAQIPATILPDSLPPFNLTAALKRVNGKAALLRKLILDFGNSYATVVPTLQSMIAEGNLADARTLAHTLKGVAGSLEIDTLPKVAATIEAALAAADTGDIDEHLTKLAGAIAPALAAVAQLRDAASVPVSHIVAPVDDAAVSVAAKTLAVSLQRRSLRARSEFDAFAKTLGMSDQMAQQHPIKLAIDKLDFESALRALNDNAPTHLEGLSL